MKLLLVDDNTQLLSILEALLSRTGHRLATAANGWEGYQRALVFRPDVVISDLDMPLMDGLTMMRHIRRHLPQVRTVYISGAPQAHWPRLEPELAGRGARLVEKPFTRDELLDAVAALKPARIEGAGAWTRMRVPAAPAPG
jgi:two-component system chemotaxis response regulator CheY